MQPLALYLLHLRADDVVIVLVLGDLDQVFHRVVPEVAEALIMFFEAIHSEERI